MTRCESACRAAPPGPLFGRFRTIADKGGLLARDGLSVFDPTATLAVHFGNGFDAGFSPYQSTRLSRYNAVSGGRHEAARVHHSYRRRGGDVAAYCACAAAGDTGDWVSPLWVARPVCLSGRCIQPGTE